MYHNQTAGEVDPVDRVIIIGGGAAGMMAAITAAECGDDVLVLERMDRVGKKVYPQATADAI